MPVKTVQVLREINEHVAGATRRFRPGITRTFPAGDADRLASRGLVRIVPPPPEPKKPKSPAKDQGKAKD